MSKILFTLLALATMTGTASAQQRTLYDSRGNAVVRSATDSQGSTTNYDARQGHQPRVHQRQHDDHDAGGRNISSLKGKAQ
ncbi:hypothetical protein ACFIOY_26345 [Bradyrhizobium sp. TZ2]